LNEEKNGFIRFSREEVKMASSILKMARIYELSNDEVGGTVSGGRGGGYGHTKIMYFLGIEET
jgi:hypothetical protein